MTKSDKIEMRHGKAKLFWLFSIAQLVAGIFCFIFTVVGASIAKDALPLWSLIFWIPWIVLNIIDMVIVKKDNKTWTMSTFGIISILFGLIGGIWMVILSDYVVFDDNSDKTKQA